MDYKPVDSPLQALLLNGKQSLLPKGQIVGTFEVTPALHLIKTGYIERYLITSDGTKGIQVIYGPDEFLPLTHAYKAIFQIDIYKGPETYYYEAMTEVTLYSINLETLLDAIDSDPAVSRDIYKELFHAAGVRLNSYIQRLENMSLRVANRKIAYQLLYLADKFGEKTTAGVTIMVPLTHQTLANILNLARETVTRHLTRLEEKELIVVSGKQITITDTEKLIRSIH